MENMDFRQELHRIRAWLARCCALANSKPRPGGCRPYFFNAGLFNDGNSLGRLAEFYAKAVEAGGVQLRHACSGRLTRAFRWSPRFRCRAGPARENFPFAYNRKEAKDHGEGGSIVGAPLAKAGC
jgi:orotate phosphoribosyltransferase